MDRGIHKSTLTLMALLLLSSSAHAQFDKFRSKTRFNQTGGSESAGQPATIISPPPANLPSEGASGGFPPPPAGIDTNDSDNWANSAGSSTKEMLDSNDDEDFDSEESGPSGLGSSPAPRDEFGRRSGGNSLKSSAPKANKFVNLNPETAFGPEVVTNFNFNNISLTELTKHMQELTGINLILDKEIKGSITINTATPITVGDAWKAYLTALQTNGFSMVKSGAFYKIVKSQDIRYHPTKLYTGSYSPEHENYTMKIMTLKNVDGQEIENKFRYFQGRYGRIISLPQTNTIIILDTGDNINRLSRLIKFIDVPGHEETLQIIPVRNSSAQEIAKLLDQILKSKSQPKAGVRRRGETSGDDISKIIAEPRTNSIIAMANADGAKKLRELINKLDIKQIASGAGKINVYYLNYGDADSLAKTLSSLVTGATAKAPASRFTPRASEGSTTADLGSLFTADVKITADKDNNALVVTASPTDYLILKEVIKKLDIPRDQVFLEGLIMETQVDRERGFGISIIGGYGTGAAQRAGFTGGSGDLFNLITGQVTSLGGLFIGGGAGKKVTQTGPDGKSITINSISGLITAVATNTDTNVLATPQLLALDNTEAVFEVGETVPRLERTNATNGSTQTTTKDQKVTLALKFTPQINKVTRFIKLKIDQKVEDFSERQLPDGLKNEAVATTLRTAITTVVVRDRDTVAMGGLMRDKEVSREAKVPLLGDIPVLGWLFKNWKKSVSKVNLIFFLTPKIMDSYESTIAKGVKDGLNRRNAHLKDAIGEDDPFASTVMSLYEKAQKQEEAPLYDRDQASRYQKQNEGPGISHGQEMKDSDEPKFEEIKPRAKLEPTPAKKEESATPDADLELLNTPTEVPPPSAELDVPDYESITQEIKSKQAATLKE